MVSVGQHENIELLSYSEVEEVSGYVGSFSVKVRRKASYVNEELCTACDICLKFFGCQPLRKDPDTGKVFIDEDRCIDCAMCIPSCPHHAIVPAETE